MEQPAANLMLLRRHRHCLILIERGLPRATAPGAGGEGSLQFVDQSGVVHHRENRKAANSQASLVTATQGVPGW